MDSRAPYLLLVSMDVQPDKESVFNVVYDTEHVPLIARVPGVRVVHRYRRQRLSMSIGGTVEDMPSQGKPRYTTIYELDNPGVLTSKEWAEAVEEGRWPDEVRPHTMNRHHVLLRHLR